MPKKNNPVQSPAKKNTINYLQASSTGFTFFEDVFDVVRQIPRGRVTTYGAIAEYLGSRMSARMVGWAMNASHQTFPPVPAQRVVNRNGVLTGKHHFATITLMQELLEKEGVLIDQDKVAEFNRLFWDPNNELNMDNC